LGKFDPMTKEKNHDSAAMTFQKRRERRERKTTKLPSLSAVVLETLI